MPKVTTKKKTAELGSRSKPARLGEKHDRFDMGDEDDNGLFVSQSTPSQPRAPRRTTASRPVQTQRPGSKLEEAYALGNMNIGKYEKNQTRRAAAGKMQSKPLEELEKTVNTHNKDWQREIENVHTRCMTGEETFTSALHTTFSSIMRDGYNTSSEAQHNSHFLQDIAQMTLTKAYDVFQEPLGRMLDMRWADSSAIFTETRNNWGADLKRTQGVLEVGRVVGEDKINIKLNGQVPAVHDPDYNDASESFFRVEDVNGTEGETWARAAKKQGKIVNRMAAAIAKD